jgi:peptide/nickel transport system permease protein
MTVAGHGGEHGLGTGIAPATFRRRLRRWTRSKTLCVGLAIVAAWVIVALIAPMIAPYSPTAQHVDAVSDPLPSWLHWMGVDTLRRDILARVIWGARPVLSIAPLALACAYLIGVTLGLVAGYYGNHVDGALSRIADILLSFPKIVLYVVLIASFGPSALNIVLAVILVSSPGIFRIVRGLTLEIRAQEYIAAARCRGESGPHIMFVEILPNARNHLIVDFCMRMGYTIVAIGVLGFLGLGLPPPDPDWGGMVREGTPMMMVYPHMVLFPSLAIISLVMGFNLVADGLQEVSDGR